MVTLKINLLGPFNVNVNGSPAVGFASDKVRALLAYLAVEHDQPHRRDFLAGFLWPGSPQKQARTSLRRALANLRKVIGDHEADPPFLAITPQTIQFNTGPAVSLDFIAFETVQTANQTWRTEPVERAVDQYTGSFMTGFSLQGSAAFEEWMLLQQERFQRQLSEMLWRLADFYLDDGKPFQALPFAWRLVEQNPWGEEGQRLLLTLLFQTGQRGAALKQIDRYRAELKRELGLDLDSQTAALWRSIKDDITMEKGKIKSFPQPDQVLVGRKSELAMLEKLFQQAQSGHPQIGFVTGDAGSGKTSLIHAFINRRCARHPSLTIIEGHGQNLVGQSDPYWPWSSALDALFESADPFLVQTLLDHGPGLIEVLVFGSTLQKLTQALDEPELAEQLLHAVEVRAERSAAIVKRQLFHEAAAFLRAVAHSRPLVIFLDDMQWADPDSIDLLSYLGGRSDLERTLFLMAWRPAEVAARQAADPDGEGRLHPFNSMVNQLRERGGCTIDLDAADGRQFIESLLKRETHLLPADFQDSLYEHTLGHPLFTVELLNHMKRDGQLRRDRSGQWVAKPDLSWEALSQRTEAVLAQKIDRLSERHVIFLTIASAAGEPFAAELIARVAGVADQEMVSILSGSLTHDHQLVTLQKCHYLGQQRLSHYRFRYPTCRTYLYGRLDEAERAYLHERLAGALTAMIDEQALINDRWAGQVARHFLEAGRPERAISFFKRAGHEAMRLAAFSQALAYYQQALALIEQLPNADERIRWEMNLQLAQGVPLMTLKGYNAPEAAAAYQRALLLMPQTGWERPADQIQALFWLSSFYTVRGQYDQSLKLADQMIELTDSVPANDVSRSLAFVLSGLPLYMMGRLDEAETHFRRALDSYRPEIHQKQVSLIGQDPGAAAYAWLAMIYTHRNQRQKAAEYAGQALGISTDLGHPYTRAFCLLIAGLSPPLLYQAFDDPAGMAAVTEMSDLADTYDFKSFRLYADFYHALYHAFAAQKSNDRSQVERALMQMKNALDDENRYGHVAGMSSRLILLAEVYRAVNRLPEGLVVLEEAEQFINRTGERYFAAELFRLRAELLLAQDANDCSGKASRALPRALMVANSQGAALFERRAADVLARLPGDPAFQSETSVDS